MVYVHPTICKDNTEDKEEKWKKHANARDYKINIKVTRSTHSMHTAHTHTHHRGTYCGNVIYIKFEQAVRPRISI